MQIIENTTNQREMWQKLNLLSIKGKRIKQQINNKFTPDELNNHFANIKITNSVKFNLSDTNNANHQNTLNEFSFECIDPETVRKAIYRIKSSAVGNDQISMLFIKLILPYITNPITNMFNLSLMSGTFPSDWKIAQVLAFSKTQNVLNVDDFRPISILPAFSKALEYIVSDQIRTHLTQHNLMDPLQSGFHKYHSTATALACITDGIRLALDKREIAYLTHLDFFKAFQSVDHKILPRKLSYFLNFSQEAVRWVKKLFV